MEDCVDIWGKASGQEGGPKPGQREGATSPSLERAEGAEQPSPAGLVLRERARQPSQWLCPREAILRGFL